MNFIDRFRLDDKVALVNGGSRGIGEAICHGLAEQGAKVIVSSRQLNSCEKVAQAIRDRGYQAEARQCHAGKLEHIDALFDGIRNDHGRLDILVNNAGTNIYYGPIAETGSDAFDKIMEINFRGPFFISVQAVEMMSRGGGGNIVNVASINGFVPGRFQGAYSAAKAAMISMTKSFALEHANDNVRCNALCPGMVRTRFMESISGDENLMKELLAKWPMGRVAEPEEMVGAVLFMASDASSFMTGQTVVVDGGAMSTLL